MNTGRWFPGGPFITGSPVETVAPDWWPQALMPSNPLLSVLAMFVNRDPLTGERLLYEVDTPGDRLRVVAGKVVPVFAPSMLSRNLPRFINALDENDVAKAAAELAGVLAIKPVIVSQTGERQRRALAAKIGENLDEIRRRLRSGVRAAGTASDTADVRERARANFQLLLELILRERQELPPVQAPQ